MVPWSEKWGLEHMCRAAPVAVAREGRDSKKTKELGRGRWRDQASKDQPGVDTSGHESCRSACPSNFHHQWLGGNPPYQPPDG